MKELKVSETNDSIDIGSGVKNLLNIKRVGENQYQLTLFNWNGRYPAEFSIKHTGTRYTIRDMGYDEIKYEVKAT